MKPTDPQSTEKRRVVRVRHAHEAGKIDGLRQQMLSDGTVFDQTDWIA